MSKDMSKGNRTAITLAVIVLTTPPVFILIAPEFNAESITLIVPPEELVISQFCLGLTKAPQQDCEY